MSQQQKLTKKQPQVLRDISSIDTTTRLFNFTSSAPFGLAPTAMQCLAHADGELATARAALSAGLPMGLSSFATQTLEDVARESGSVPNVLQLYLFEERAHSEKLIARAKKAGYKAVYLTVDTPMLGRRNLEIRNRFKLPKTFRIANFAEDANSEAAANVMNGAAGSSADGDQERKVSDAGQGSRSGYHDGTSRRPPSGPITFHSHAANPTLSWERDIKWLKEECGEDMQVWVKGVATAEDALLAVHHGVDGIVVSNHGGRQLNGALATLDALPEVVEAVGGRIPVHVDGGIRHGTVSLECCVTSHDVLLIFRTGHLQSTRARSGFRIHRTTGVVGSCVQWTGWC